MKKKMVLKKEVKDEIINELLDLGYILFGLGFCYFMWLYF